MDIIIPLKRALLNNVPTTRIRSLLLKVQVPIPPSVQRALKGIYKPLC